MTVRNNYEVSSEGCVRHWEIPYARLTNTTPVPTEAAAVTSILPGTQLTGTVLVTDDDDDVAVIDFTCSMVYRHYVRNVRTYAQGAEATWAAINIGDPVYYDASAGLPANCDLSTSPLSQTGVQNALFGFIVPTDPDNMALYPLGGANAGSTQLCGVSQVGAGA
jgi:hypothetical protein